MNITPEQWHVVSTLFDDALEQPASDRERWLDALPEEHGELRDILRKLLAAHAEIETADFLQTVPKFAGARTPRDFADSAFAQKSVVGPYVLESEIGRGGMGTVWRAQRTDGVVKRTIALKLPHAGLLGPQIAQRFALERDILAELNHPNIARLYDAGTTEGGQPYLALEFVEGAPLTEYCDGHRLDARQRLQLAMQMLEAVRYAHTRLVIHRDLKPSNILVTPDGQVRLLDFGIAKLLSSRTTRTALTEIGARALTPDYAAPELLSGDTVTTATDVYSSGVVLYELLTGERPYRLARNSLGALEQAIMSGDPVRPSLTTITDGNALNRNSTPAKLRRALTGDLDTIILKALKKRPDERYTTIDALREDLERYLDGRPVLARPDSRWYVTKKFIARHRLPMGIGAAALSAVLVAATVALFEAGSADKERDRALRMSARNEAVSSFLNTLITESAQSEKPVTVNDMLAQSEKLAEIQYSGDPESRAAVLDMVGTYYFSIGEDARAEPLLSEAQQMIGASGDWDLRARITCDHSAAAARMGKREEAARALRQTIDDSRTSDQQAAECLQYLASMARDVNDFTSALDLAQQALLRLRRVKHPEGSLEAAFLGDIGFAEHLAGRNDLAEEYYARALQKFSESGREHSANAIAIRNNWAIVSDGAGDQKHALELYDQTLHMISANERNQLPPIYLIANRARALYSIGRYQESIETYRQCVARTADLTQGYCLLGLALDYFEQGDDAAAQDYLAKAATIIDRVSPTGSPPTLAVNIMRGKVALTEHRFGDAQKLLTSVIDGHKTTSAAPTALTVRSEVSLNESNLTQAAADAREAISLGEALQGGKPYSNRTGLAWLILGRVLEKADDIAGAKSAFEAAVRHLSNTVDPNHPALQEAQRHLASLITESKPTS